MKLSSYNKNTHILCLGLFGGNVKIVFLFSDKFNLLYNEYNLNYLK